MIHVIANITTKPGQRETVLTALKANIPAVLAEKGCIEYQPVIDAENAGKVQTPLGADSFIVVEKWETMDDLAAHASSKHMSDYAKEVGHMIADRTIHVLSNT